MAEISNKLIRLWNKHFEADNIIKTFLIIGNGNAHYRAWSNTNIRMLYPFRYSGPCSVPEETQEIESFVSLADALQQGLAVKC